MQVHEVGNAKMLKWFHRVPHRVYRGHREYVYPLEVDVEYVFNRQKNPAYIDGEATRFVLLNDQQKPVGRIAAFYRDPEVDGISTHKPGHFGFIECIDDTTAFNNLLKAAEDWLKAKGRTSVCGPVNFGERDKFWGLSVQSQTPASYLQNAHLPYYQKHFEQNGYAECEAQLTYAIEKIDYNASRFGKVAEWVKRKPGFVFEHFRETEAKRFARDLTIIYNETHKAHPQFQPLTRQKMMSYFKAMRHLLVEEFIWFAYYQERPIGVLLTIPDVNQVLKPLKGKLGLWGRLQFRFYRNVLSIDRLKGMVFGMVPDYQKHGIEAVLIHELYRETMARPQFERIELTVDATFQDKMQTLLQHVKGEVVKKHVVLCKDL